MDILWPNNLISDVAMKHICMDWKIYSGLKVDEKMDSVSIMRCPSLFTLSVITLNPCLSTGHSASILIFLVYCYFSLCAQLIFDFSLTLFLGHT